MARLFYFLLFASVELIRARTIKPSHQRANDVSVPNLPSTDDSSHAPNTLKSPLVSRGRLHPRVEWDQPFMESLVDGARRWREFQKALNDRKALNDHTGGDLKRISLEYDDHTAVLEEEGECKEPVPVAVPGKNGWRYGPVKPEVSVQLSTIFHAIDLDGKVQLQGLHATLWEDPKVVVSIYFDCENGILVRNLAYLRYQDESGKPHYTKDHWSDVAWALYEKACPNSLQKLRYVIVDVVRNSFSKSTLEEAAAAVGHWNPKNAKENSFVFTNWEAPKLTRPDSKNTCSGKGKGCDFFAVLHTPNAIGVLHLLKDHRQQLNSKSIKSITAFYNCLFQNPEGKAFVEWTMFITLT